MSCKFRTVYPNVYAPDEQELVDKTLEFIGGDTEKLETQLKDQLENRTRGIGNMELNGGLALPCTTLGSSDLLEKAKSLYPLNPLYADEAYSRSQNDGRFLAAPLQVMMGPAFPYIPKGMDLWISNSDFTKGRGLDHEYTYYKPLYAGDTIRTRLVSQGLKDVSEGGDTMRKFRVTGEQAVYNQHGELLSTCWNSAIETFKVPEDISKLDEYDGPRVIAFNGYADWDKVRPRHKYTSDDWEYIRSLWDAEVIRGEDTLYWEDVNIGDMPAPTCDGPLGGRSGPSPGEISGATVRDYICGNVVKDFMGNPMKLTAEQDQWGEYTVRAEMGPMPGPMRRPGSNHPNYRPSLMNTVGRDCAARFVTNWMGNKGFLHKICWRLAFCWDEGRNVFPADHDRPSFLLKVPFLKEQGKFMNTHSYTGDLAIVRGYVCDKYIKDGKHYVDMPIWIETIEGDIWAECFAVVALPSRS